MKPQNGACQGTSTPAGPSAIDTKIAQRGTISRVLFWLGGSIWACGGRGCKYQCIISSMETLLVLSSSTHGVTFIWCRRFLRSVFLIIKKGWLAIGPPCNWFMARRQRTKFTGETRKVTYLFYHQGKSNPTEEGMAVLCWIVITIDGGNDPALENLPEQ